MRIDSSPWAGWANRESRLTGCDHSSFFFALKLSVIEVTIYPKRLLWRSRWLSSKIAVIDTCLLQDNRSMTK
jgi:hypothetical protein